MVSLEGSIPSKLIYGEMVTGTRGHSGKLSKSNHNFTSDKARSWDAVNARPGYF